MSFRYLIVIPLIFLLLTSCKETPVVNTPHSPLSPLATPTPIATQTPVPTPTMVPPQAKSGFGSVYGQIIGKTNRPIKDLTVRLGQISWIDGQEGKEGLVMSDRSRSPKGITDEHGYFTIENIPLGEYGIVINNPLDETPFFISEVAEKKLKVLIIKDKGVIRLGQLQIPHE